MYELSNIESEQHTWQEKLIVISSANPTPGDIRVLNELFALGLGRFHLRAPLYSKDELRTLLRTIDPHYRRRVAMHSHFSLVEEFELGGVHVPEMIRRNSFLNDSASTIADRCDATLSSSFHSLEDLRDESSGFSYAFLSPIFGSISKPGYVTEVSRSEMYQALSEIDLPVFALGGIEPSRVAEALALGFYGVATLGAIWRNEDPIVSTLSFREAFR